MKYFTLTLENELCTLDKYNLDATELLVIRVLLILQTDDDNSLFTKLLSTFRHIGIKFRDVLVSLQNKGVILKSFHIPPEGSPFDPYEIPINKNFIKNLYKASYEMGKELFEVYPQFGNISGNVVPLRGIAKKYNSLEDAYMHYAKSINHDPEMHSTIIDLVKWANENNIINCSLASFIVNQGWLDLEALKNGDKVNVNYDTVKLL